jgi:hypothetical protein
MSLQDEVATGHIAIPGDVLIPDKEFRETVLRGACPRTARRLDDDGLPFIMIAGRKFRPLNEGRAWLAQQIVRRPKTDPDTDAKRRPVKGGARKPTRGRFRSIAWLHWSTAPRLEEQDP